MGFFDEWASEEIHRDQIEIDEDEETITVKYGTDQSVSGAVQNQIQTTFLAELLVRTKQQNELIERQNELLEELAE